MLWRKLIKEYIYNETKNHYIKIIEKFQTPLEYSIIFYQCKAFFIKTWKVESFASNKLSLRMKYVPYNCIIDLCIIFQYNNS